MPNFLASWQPSERRDAGAAERTGLENRSGGNSTGGSNPLSPPKFNHLHIIKSVTKITLGITWNIFLEYFQVTGHQVLVKL